MASAFDSMMPPTPEVIQRCNRLLSIPDATDIHGQDTPPPIGRMALLLGQAGLLGLTVSNGGHGLGVLAAVHALETVGRHRPFFVDPLFFGNFSITRVIGDAAESTCRGRYLARVIRGEAILPMAISAPEAGAAAADLKWMLSELPRRVELWVGGDAAPRLGIHDPGLKTVTTFAELDAALEHIRG